MRKRTEPAKGKPAPKGKKPAAVPAIAGIVGSEPKIRKLSLFSSNSWNPNAMEPDEYELMLVRRRAPSSGV